MMDLTCAKERYWADIQTHVPHMLRGRIAKTAPWTSVNKWKMRKMSEMIHFNTVREKYWVATQFRVAKHKIFRYCVCLFPFSWCIFAISVSFQSKMRATEML